MSERIGLSPWPPRPVFRSGGHVATPRPVEGVVTWNINTTCNYRCSYCTQRFLDDRKRWLRDGTAFLSGFARLDGRWEVKISGGEPFLHPNLLEIVCGLRTLGHAVSVVTNFSASREKLRAFLDAAGASLRVFSASLHLEYAGEKAEMEAFIRKAVWVQEQLHAGATLNVTCVATRASLPRLEEVARSFARRGLRFKVQPEKQDREVIPYTEAEKLLILRLGGHNGLGEVAPSFKGRPCWAGSRSFTLDDRGNAWRCYPARRFRAQYLGNFLDGSFRLARGPSACLYSYCNCTVPIERGMMPRDTQSEEGIR
ncbi:MAG TPA: radical SAM protein [Pyrinomonadaceae bacterium]|jgi:MoaA/NifB/PqqE/SkfB family radical SAM enzyme